MSVQITQLFEPVLITDTAATIYTVPTSPATLVLFRGRVRFTNTDTATRSVTVYAVPKGGTAATTNIVANGESIAPNDHLDLDIPVLAAGGFIQALTDSSGKVSASALDGLLFS